eukprot:403340073
MQYKLKKNANSSQDFTNHIQQNSMVSSDLSFQQNKLRFSGNASPISRDLAATSNNIYNQDPSKLRLNICQWISFGFLVLVFLFLFGFLIYQWSTWGKVRINRYG